MRGTTHLLAGLLLAAVITRLYPYDRPLLVIALILFASLLPDIDERKSLLGRRLPVIGWLVRHRTFFHGVLFLVCCVILLSIVLPQPYVWAFAVAFLVHLLLDAMTPQGVTPFWPSPVRISGFIRVGGVLEAMLFVVMVVLFVLLLL